MRIAAGPNANADTPVAVDVVFAMDADSLAAVANLAAGKWFKEREQLRLAYPRGLLVVSYEVVPQRSVSHDVTGDEDEAVGAFVFADYASPGTHRARIDRLKTAVIRLGQTAFFIDDKAK